LKKKEKDLDFNEIDERLAAGCYVHSDQRKRYLKSIIKDKKEQFYIVLLILLSVRAALRAKCRKHLQNLVIA